MTPRLLARARPQAWSSRPRVLIPPSTTRLHTDRVHERLFFGDLLIFRKAGPEMFDAASFVVEAVSLGVALFSEIDRRRGARHPEAAAVLQSIDTADLVAEFSDAALAGMMRGGVHAKSVRGALSDDGVRLLARELVVAAVVGDHEDELAQLEAGLADALATALGRSASAGDAEFFGTEFARALRTGIAKVVSAAREADADGFAQLQQLNAIKRVGAILQAASRHRAAVARARDEALVKARDSFLKEYRRLSSEFHGSIQPPDFERNRKVPIEDLYVLPRIHHAEDLGIDDDLGDFDSFANRVDRTVVLGDPGGGKSTLTNYLVWRLAREQGTKISFHITLREFVKQAHTSSILQYIEAQLPARYQIVAPAGVVEDLLLTGQALVIFDGLDELIDTSRRREVTTAVEMFGLHYPNAKILVTSRRVGYEQARLDPGVFEVLQIGNFNDADVAGYVHKWFASQDEYSADQAGAQSRSFIEQSAAVADLRSNPLMLSLMCIIFRGENFIPRKRPEIYERCANLLFEKWDGHRQIEVPLRARDHVDSALKYVAFLFLHTGAGDEGIRYSDLVREMTEYLFSRALETREAAEVAATEFVDFCKGRAWVLSDAGTTADGEAIYAFTHRTFMEYFAAIHLIRTTDTPEKLARHLLPKIAKEEWDVVAQLAVQQEEKVADKGSERVLRVMLEEPRRRATVSRANVLAFIGRCTKFAVLSPAFVRQLTTEVLSFALKQDVENPQDITARPWMVLLKSASDDYVDTVGSAMEEMLRAAIQGKDRAQRETAMYLLVCYLARASQFNLRWGDRGGTDRWSALLERLAAEERVALVEAGAESRSDALSLAAAGVVSFEEAVVSMRDAGLTLSEMYFGSAKFLQRSVPADSIAAYICLVAAQAGDAPAEPVPNVAIQLANWFAEDFWVRDRGSLPDTLAGYWFGLAADSGIFRAPQPLLDASVLVSLGMVEVIEHRYHRRPRARLRRFAADLVESGPLRGSFSLTALEEAALSSRVKHFVNDWARDEARVFADGAESETSAH